MATRHLAFRGTAAHSPSMAALTREGGDGTGPVDFCIPCNPYFPTPAMFDELAGRLREIITYYPSSADTITAELCNLLQLPPSCVAMGNGSTELITWIDHLLVRESLAVPVPTFGRWTDQPMETGKRVDMFPLQESSGFALDLAQYAEFIRKRGTRVAVVCNPNNPDGGFVPRQALVQFMDAMADLDLVVIDESFLEFADAENEPSVVQDAVMRPTSSCCAASARTSDCTAYASATWSPIPRSRAGSARCCRSGTSTPSRSTWCSC